MTPKLKRAAGKYSGLPERYREPMRKYVEQGIPFGSFFRAVLSNDLQLAISFEEFARELSDLPKVYKWMSEHLPSQMWGSRERLQLWMRHKISEVK